MTMESKYLDKKINVLMKNEEGNICLLEADDYNELVNYYNEQCGINGSYNDKVLFASFAGKPLNPYECYDFISVGQYIRNLPKEELFKEYEPNILKFSGELPEKNFTADKIRNDEKQINEQQKNVELTLDGAIGYIEDVTNEEWYKDPDITLYDDLEQATYDLICDYAEIIGVHLVKEAPDFALISEIRDHVINMLEKEFDISFPIYNITNLKDNSLNNEEDSLVVNDKELFDKFVEDLKIYVMSFVNSAGFDDGSESLVTLYSSKEECLASEYAEYTKLWGELSEEYGISLHEENVFLSKEKFEEELLTYGYVLIQMPDYHIQFEYEEKDRAVSKDFYNSILGKVVDDFEAHRTSLADKISVADEIRKDNAKVLNTDVNKSTHEGPQL